MKDTELREMDLDKLQQVDVRTVNPETLVDIRELEIDKNLPKEERIAEFVRQIKNPFCFKVGKVIVGVSYSNDGVTFDQRMQHYLQTL